MKMKNRKYKQISYKAQQKCRRLDEFESPPQCPNCESKDIIEGMEQGIVEYDCEKCNHHWKI